MAIGTPVQLGTFGMSGSSTTIALTTTTNAPAGSLIVVVVSNTGGIAPTSATDSASNSYSVGSTAASGTASVTLLWCLNANALNSGQTITVTFASSAANRQITAFAVSGVASADLTGNAGATATGTSVSLATGALSSANAIVFGALDINGSIASGPSATGFTFGTSVTTTGQVLALAYQIVSSTASVTFNATWTTSRTGAANVATFVGSAAQPNYDPRVRLAYLDF